MVRMKKYLFIAALLLSNSANASFYLKSGVGLNNIKNKKFSNCEYEGKVKLSDNFPLLELGVGYKFDNGIRVESVVDYYFLFRTSETSRNLNADRFKIFAKTKANALMFNVYKDIVSFGNFTPFVGGGVGVGFLKESVSGYAVSNEDNITYNLDSVVKNSSRFAYKLTIGNDIKINDNYTCEISYNYFNLGSSKRKNIGNNTYEIHNITLNVRFTI